MNNVNRTFKEAGLSPLTGTKANKAKSRGETLPKRTNPNRSPKTVLSYAKNFILECKVCKYPKLFHRVQMLNRHHIFSIIALMELFHI